MASRAPGISPRQFAIQIGVAPSTISRAIKEGRLRRSIVRYGPRYRVVDVELAKIEYATHTREIAGKLGDANIPAAGGHVPTKKKTTSSGSSDYNRQRTEKLKVDRQLAELKLKRERRELIPIAEVSRVAGEALAALRRRLLSIPDRLSGELIGMTDGGEIRNLLRAEIRQSLASASEAIERGEP